MFKTFIIVVIPNTGYRPRFCYLPAVAGTCKAYMPRWYYNCATRACEKFIYGGCGGNRNRFDTELACRRRCKAKCKGLVNCDQKCKSGFMKDGKGCPICRCVDLVRSLFFAYIIFDSSRFVPRSACVSTSATCQSEPDTALPICHVGSTTRTPDSARTHEVWAGNPVFSSAVGFGWVSSTVKMYQSITRNAYEVR
ncbi:Kunitz-type serine protease inhibitor PPTI [Lamellibrachia satsuma]|nr:Kunitz-type serine protease inhibitor PPTI [Lamellibrachia satsuma]